MSRKLKIGVIGAGGIARRRTLPAIQSSSLLEVVAVMDVVGAAEVAGELGVPRYYADEASLVNDPEVEVVYIASPVFRHLDQVRLAAGCGKAVFCEKPVARNLAETEAALALCEERGVPFMEGYMMNFHGAHQLARAMIAGGEIGHPVSMRAQLSCWYPPIAGAWRQNPELGGGGSLIDMATHCFSLLEHLTQDRVTGVFAMTTNQVHGYTSEDSATILLQFSKGTHATVDSFFCMRDEASRNRLEVYGDRGGFLAEGTLGQDSGGSLQAITGLGNVGYDAGQSARVEEGYRSLNYEKVNPYLEEWEYFARCVFEGRAPLINGLGEARHIAALTDAAYRSWREQRFLEV